MLHIALFTVLFLFSEVKTYELSKSTYSDVNNKSIDVKKYCEKQKCLVKCCPDGEFIARTAAGERCVEPKLIRKLLNFSRIDVYRSDLRKTGKNLKSEFLFIQNNLLSEANKTYTFPDCDKLYFLEDGSLQTVSENCPDPSKLSYCVDFYYRKVNNTPGVVLAYRVLIPSDEQSKIDFIEVAMLISSFFMFLVILVYALLPKLQNIVGMILMAYLVTLMIAFILKAAQLIGLTSLHMTSIQCRYTTPAVYYFVLASICWLNIMSFDLWWTIRGTRKRRDIHRKGELRKFMWYCLYAWGIPALITLIAVVVDILHLYNNKRNRPPFESCFAEKRPTALYLHIPIGIMTSTNFILFLLTAYNIYLIKSAVNRTKDSSSTKRSENRFAIYINLFALMGVSWILELVPELPTAAHIIVNFYNAFIGVAIFIIFVCKKSIFLMLCHRFNIKNKYVDKWQPSRSIKSETTKSSLMKKSRDSSNNEATELTALPTKE